MCTRREALVAGFLVTASCTFCGLEVLQAQTPRRRGRGCMLSVRDAGSFMNTATREQLYETGHEPMISNSGDKDFDFALAQTLAKLSDVLTVLPGFAYYDDYDGANAYATKTIRLQNADGTVLFGRRLLKRLLATPESPDAAVAAVCAHEFGHILQYKRGLDRVVGDGQPTVKRIELQADFFAGFFAGTRKRERGDFPAAIFALTQFNSGDNMIEDSQHHGTQEERGAAISRGFDAAYRDHLSLPDAIEASIAYVTRI
jgi:putative neutral zinc metallopeptidase